MNTGVSRDIESKRKYYTCLDSLNYESFMSSSLTLTTLNYFPKFKVKPENRLSAFHILKYLFGKKSLRRLDGQQIDHQIYIKF